MIGLGTIINTAGIVAGGVAGLFCGKLIKERHRQTLTAACGISVLFIGIAGGMEGMLALSEGKIVSGKAMLVTLCLALGALIGELINIEGAFEKFGEWLKRKTGNAKDGNFTESFLNASFTVCIGAMAIIGSIKDGTEGDYSILAVKSVLDIVIVMVMAASTGKGSIFSALPVFVLEGGMTLLSRLLVPILTDLAMSYLSLVGSVLIFCVGVNLVWGKKVRVANFLPSLVLAVGAAFLPFSI